MTEKRNGKLKKDFVYYFYIIKTILIRTYLSCSITRIISTNRKQINRHFVQYSGCAQEVPRNAANARERTRMRVLSKAFGRLKLTLPWVPPDTKVSRLNLFYLSICGSWILIRIRIRRILYFWQPRIRILSIFELLLNIFKYIFSAIKQTVQFNHDHNEML